MRSELRVRAACEWRRRRGRPVQTRGGNRAFGRNGLHTRSPGCVLLRDRCGLSVKDSPSVWRATRSELEMTEKGWRGDGLLTLWQGYDGLGNPRRVAVDFGCRCRLAGIECGLQRWSARQPAPNQSAHATPAPTRSWTTSSGEIWKPEDTGLQTTDPDKNGFVGRLPVVNATLR